MTDNEIIKALECCALTPVDCKVCPYDNGDCRQSGRDALDLIKRQQAEIEWNKIKIEEMRQERQEYFENNKKYRAGIEEKYEKMFLEAEAQIRPKAIREYADKLEADIGDEDFYVQDKLLLMSMIESLAKKMGCGE